MSTKMSVNQVCVMFGVGIMTVYLWRTHGLRKLPSNERLKLPYEQSGRRIHLVYKDVVAWAKAVGLKPVTTLREAQEKAPARKPGPKTAQE